MRLLPPVSVRGDTSRGATLCISITHCVSQLGVEYFTVKMRNTNSKTVYIYDVEYTLGSVMYVDVCSVMYKSTQLIAARIGPIWQALRKQIKEQTNNVTMTRSMV